MLPAAPCPEGQDSAPPAVGLSGGPEPVERAACAKLLGRPAAGLEVRPMQLADLERGYLEALDALRPASGLERARAAEALERIRANPWHRVFVAEAGGRIVGTLTVLVEQKLIHEAGRVAHIEDVAVHRDWQGRGVGRALMLYALAYAEAQGCYKTILDCEEHLRGFYEGLGMRRVAHTMRLDHPQ